MLLSHKLISTFQKNHNYRLTENEAIQRIANIILNKLKKVLREKHKLTEMETLDYANIILRQLNAGTSAKLITALWENPKIYYQLINVK